MEKILFKRRMIKAGIVCVMLNIIDILACYSGLLVLYKKGVVNSTSFNETLVTGDFHSVLQYGVVYMFIFVIYIEYVIGKDRVEKLIRYEQRKTYFYGQIKGVLIATLEFVVIHELTSVVYVLLYGDYKIIMQHNWIEGIVFQMVISILYYLITYFVLILVKLKWKKNMAITYTILFMALQYYISVNLLPFIYMPVKDVAIITNICSGQYTWIKSVLVLLRIMIITIALGNICLNKKEQEDIL